MALGGGKQWQRGPCRNCKSQIGDVGVPDRKGDGGGMESQQTKPGLPDTHLGGVHHCIGNLAVGPVSGRCVGALYGPGNLAGQRLGLGRWLDAINHGPGSFRQGHDSRSSNRIWLDPGGTTRSRDGRLTRDGNAACPVPTTATPGAA